MSFRDKESRRNCYDSRDRYWECLDAIEKTATVANSPVNQTLKQATSAPVQSKYGTPRNNLMVDSNNLPLSNKPCLELRKLCEESCPEHWIKHFDRKRQYMKFREKVAAVGRMTNDEVASSSKTTFRSDNVVANSEGNVTEPEESKRKIDNKDYTHISKLEERQFRSPIPKIYLPNDAEQICNLKDAPSHRNIDTYDTTTPMLSLLELMNVKPDHLLTPSTPSSYISFRNRIRPLSSPPNMINMVFKDSVFNQDGGSYSSIHVPQISTSPSLSSLSPPPKSENVLPSLVPSDATSLGQILTRPLRRRRVYRQEVFNQRLVPSS